MDLATETQQYHKAPDDDDDITEIVKMEADAIHAVGSPASGLPWLLMKGADDTELTGPEALAIVRKAREQGIGGPVKVTVKSEDLEWFAKQVSDAGGYIADESGRVLKSDSGEADAIEELVSGEASEHETPRHPVTGQFLPDTLEGHAMSNLAAAEKQLDDLMNRDGLVLEPELTAARARVAKARLVAINTPPERAAKSESVTPVQKAIARNLALMKMHFDGLPDGDERGTDLERRQHVEKQDAGLKLSHTTLAVTSALRSDAQARATEDMIHAAQQQALTPASLGGGDPQEQVRRIGGGTGSPESLGTPAGANRGDFSGATVGQHAEPPVQGLRALEDEFNETADPLEKARLGEQLTRRRLVDMYAAKEGNGGDATPSVTAQRDAADVGSVAGAVKPDYLAKARKKADKRAIKRAVRKALA
jgi:hypothetical protein